MIAERVDLVVNMKTSEYEVRIDRRTKWGNPYVIGRDGTRDEVIAKYKRYLDTRPDLLAVLHELKGKVLGCWCKPRKCHGDILSEMANR